jgi:hypothetical protein
MKKLLLIAFIFVLFSSCEKDGMENMDSNFRLLENKNFKVDSYNWPVKEINGIVYKINNPDNNDYVIVEFVSGVADYLIGEQLFSHSAAQIEVDKVEKQLPTSYEFDECLKETFNKKLDQFGGVSDVNTDLLDNRIKSGFITIQYNDSELNMNEFNLHDQNRGCAFWSFAGTLSIQILDKDITRNNFFDHGQQYLLSVRCKK